ISQSPKNSYTVIPMKSTPGLKVEFAMAMGVRNSDKARKEMLDRLITDNKDEIQSIIASYHIPLTEIQAQEIRSDDD
ncbi:MAG: ABC transporter substrate-binding protein, partial [Methylosarcina sp.]